MLTTIIKKTLSNILIALLLFLLSCNSIKKEHKNNVKTNKEKWKSFVLGDIDNNGSIDTAFVFTPEYYETIDLKNPDNIQFDSCKNNKCFNKIKFSSIFNEIYINNTLWGKVESIEDLDGDGINEIIFQTNWWLGTHVEIIIYSYNKSTNKWGILAKNRLYEEESYKDRVTKINNERFKFKIEYMDTVESDLKTKEVIIEIDK
jgi:hypothetical protein